MGAGQTALQAADLLITEADVANIFSELQQSIENGDVTGTMASVSELAAAILGPQQAALAITSAGLTFTNAVKN